MRSPFTIQLPEGSTLSRRDQICQSISEAISARRLVMGQRLPSCRALAAELNTSRNTVHAAYERLIDLGLVVSKDRSGYRVSADALSELPLAHQAQETDGGFALWDRLPGTGQRASDMPMVEHPADWARYPYPFIYNQIDPRIFPVQSWRECMRLAQNVNRLQVWSGDAESADSAQLIDHLCQRLMNFRGLAARPEEVLITSGAQNALFILGMLFAGKSQRVAMENPGYPEARNAFALSGNRVVDVPVDGQGMDVQAIPKDCGMVYTTPSHQFPTTVAMPIERRHALLARAAERNMVVIEDDYEAELNYQQDTLPSLRSMDDDGRVVYVGSLSKTLSPGLRLGFMVAHPALIKEARAIRRAMLRHPPTLIQEAMANFLALGHHAAHLRRLHRRYKTRWEAMQSAMAAHLPGFASSGAQGGTCFWVDGPSGLDVDRLEQALQQRGVLINNGKVFFTKPEDGRGKFRLGFASLPVKSIEPGIRIIGEEISNLL